MEFEKSLSPSEAKYKYLGLPKKIRAEFPPKDEIFQVEFKKVIQNESQQQKLHYD